MIQDENHTVWSTSCGHLYRSAPENTRLAFPEEGLPEGPELPDDVTPLIQQIHRMQNNPSNPEIPNDFPRASQDQDPYNIPDEPDEINPNNDNLNPTSIPESMSNDSQDESIPQPDQEPEGVSHESSQADGPDQTTEENDGHQATGDPELVQLTCHEIANALTCETPEHTAWRYEFEISQPPGMGPNEPSAHGSCWQLLPRNNTQK